MAVSNEQFLFSCINHSNGGTINWQKVADECDIISKGAANIKFTRMKAKFGTVGGAQGSTPTKKSTSADGGEDDEAASNTTSKKPVTKTFTPKKTASKKRKLSEEEDEEESPVKREKEDHDF